MTNDTNTDDTERTVTVAMEVHAFGESLGGVFANEEDASEWAGNQDSIYVFIDCPFHETQHSLESDTCWGERIEQ